MGVLDLQTDLKSLKYGQDRPNGGSSGQPYIQTDIRTVDATFSRANLTLYDDGLIRGGIVASTNASFTDTRRIAKFFTDVPKGPLFITKQVGLQLSNPQLEQKGSTTERYIGPSRIYNLGINTLAQVPLTAFGEHIVRHGLLPVNNPDTYYESVVAANNFQDDGKENRLFKLLNKLNEGTLDKINEYTGGPGSAYGIGSTLIRKAEVRQVDNYEYQNWNAGLAIVNGERKAFDYIDPETLDGAITSDLGQRNRFSIKNGARHIGGIAYQLKWKESKAPELLNVFENTIDDPIELAKGVDQSVYGSNNPTSQLLQNSKDYAGNSRVTGDKIKLFQTADFGISTQTGSIFNGGKSFNLLSDINNINENTSPFFFVGSNEDKKKQWFAGLSSETIDTVKVRENSDFEISTKTSSSFASQQFDLRTEINNLDNNPPLYNFVASTNDTGSHDRKSGIPDLKNINDTNTKAGPSTYPGTDANNTDNKDGVLDLPSLAYNFINPNLKTYSTISDEIKKQTSKGIPLIHTSIGGAAGKYKYNTGTKLVFNRANDRKVTKDTLAIKFKPVNPFGGFLTENLNFLAYLTDYSDSFDSTWGDTKYVGRAEKFYIFNEFKRSISLGFNIPCFNRKELRDNHNKLNQLVSILAGKYKGTLLGGIITYLKLGNYIDNQPGIITSLSFNPIEESSWDLRGEVAFYIKVSLNFTLIHNNLPEFDSDFITVADIPDAADDDGNTGQALPSSGGSRVIVDNSISYPEVTFGRQTPASIGF